MARTGGEGGARDELHGRAPDDAPPLPLPLQVAGAEYFEMGFGEDVGQAPAAGRPAPLLEVLPQARFGQHGGIGYELVPSSVVPQLGGDEVGVVRDNEFGAGRGGYGWRGVRLRNAEVAELAQETPEVQAARDPAEVRPRRQVIA